MTEPYLDGSPRPRKVREAPEILATQLNVDLILWQVLYTTSGR